MKYKKLKVMKRKQKFGIKPELLSLIFLSALKECTCTQNLFRHASCVRMYE